MVLWKNKSCVYFCSTRIRWMIYNIYMWQLNKNRINLAIVENIFFTAELKTPVTILDCQLFFFSFFLPEQRRWSVWRTCWGGPPLAAAWLSQSAGGRCEHRLWTGASGWSLPLTWSFSWRGHLGDRTEKCSIRQILIKNNSFRHKVTSPS